MHENVNKNQFADFLENAGMSKGEQKAARMNAIPDASDFEGEYAGGYSTSKFGSPALKAISEERMRELKVKKHYNNE